ncbi:MAG: RimK domain protein ATP-grasp [Candidatus Yanofskybacteria bacterium GW2011_GWA2_44_10]|uniref:RimK domain protein ATP-grasp n=1 Tax=Candidatus Yanofskybacteria bacterium GW2011_GWB1_45_11 TaxID=1619026 RepID=A0A0G1L3R9_9BACT|nr:MAG: RimK domain protein ATP-grasp [Candidatus Yanofskybacteria bacterium GW2011_GWA2_44_10]KKT90400.1 MAG: RimK domain protein ATP-grasp [Candidatus Yanofskybacteria bacterium GW2011_GWB1_45_11]
MILILSGSEDPHCQYIVEKIKARNRKFVVYDYGQYPSNSQIGLKIDRNSKELWLHFSDIRLNCEEIRSVWNRRRGQSKAGVNIKNPKITEYIEQESQILLDSLPYLIKTDWISHPDAITISARKPYQLLVAKSLNLAIPETVIGNSSEMIEKYVSLDSMLALKPLSMATVSLCDGENDPASNLILYTKPVTHDQIIKKTRRVVNCPVTVQKYIPKEFELRITVVGNQAFACAIYSQETERTTHDWRKYDLTHTPHKVFNLPDDINQKCLTLVDKLGLKFGCIDMIVTPEGQFVFLEINPNGQWLWIERLTNLPIGDAITDLLCLDNQR